jgi:hypothetical protein
MTSIILFIQEKTPYLKNNVKVWEETEIIKLGEIFLEDNQPLPRIGETIEYGENYVVDKIHHLIEHNIIQILVKESWSDIQS